VNPTLAEDGFHVNLHGSLSYCHLACDGLVGITLDHAMQDGSLTCGQSRPISDLGRCYPFIRSNGGANYRNLFAAIVITISVSLISYAAAAVAGFPVRDQSQNFWRHESHAKRDRFERFDKCLARRDLGQIRAGGQLERRHHLGQFMLIGEHDDTPARKPLLERLDPPRSSVDIVAHIDHEQDWLLLREGVQDVIVCAKRRTDDKTIGCPQNTS